MIGIFLIVLSFLLLWEVRVWSQEMETKEESYWGIFEPLEEGYWGSIYEREFKIEKRAPLTFSLDLKEEYDDNIFSTEENQSRDIITSITPGIWVNSRGLRHSVSFDYRLKVTRYADADPAAGVDLKELDYIGHNLNLWAKRMVTERFKIGIEERFLLSRRPTDMFLATNRISAAKYYRNWVSPYLEYQLGERSALRLKFQFDTLHYQDVFTLSDEDSESCSGYLSIGYRKSEKTQVFLDCQNFSRDYDWSSGYEANQVLLGFRRLFNPIFRGEFSFGYQERDFDKEIKGVVEDMREFIGLARIIGETKKSRAELSYLHYPADLSEGGYYYISDRISLGIFYFPSPKFKLAASFFFDGVKYDQERGYTDSGRLKKREDNLYGGDWLIEYTVKQWLILSLGYTRIERDSNLREGDYKENRIYFSITGAMDLWKK
jgi:hypothetical protein